MEELLSLCVTEQKETRCELAEVTASAFTSGTVEPQTKQFLHQTAHNNIWGWTCSHWVGIINRGSGEAAVRAALCPQETPELCRTGLTAADWPCRSSAPAAETSLLWFVRYCEHFHSSSPANTQWTLTSETLTYCPVWQAEVSEINF